MLKYLYMLCPQKRLERIGNLPQQHVFHNVVVVVVRIRHLRVKVEYCQSIAPKIQRRLLVPDVMDINAMSLQIDVCPRKPFWRCEAQ